MKTLPFAVPTLLVVLGCQPDQHGGTGLAGVPVDTLQAELLARDPAIGAPGFIHPWGNRLLVSDWQGSPQLHAIDAATGDLLVSFGRVGGGPGEFGGLIAGIQVPRHDPSAAWVYETGKLTRLERTGAVSSEAATVRLGGVVPYAAWLDSATIVGVALQPATERFVFFDNAGNVTRTVAGDLLGQDDVPMAERVRASAQFSLCPHPEGRGFAVAYKHAARVDIYSRTGERAVAAEVPRRSEPTFENRDGDIRFVSDRLHYSQCWGSNDLLYVLYSGDDYRRARRAEIGEGQSIHLFDWESGRLTGELHLDTRIFGFAVARSEGWLYAGSLSDGGIHRFRLPEAADG